MKRWVLVALAATSLAGLGLATAFHAKLWIVHRTSLDWEFWPILYLMFIVLVPASLMLVGLRMRKPVKQVVLHLVQGLPRPLRIALAALFVYALTNWALIIEGSIHGKMRMEDDNPAFVRMLTAFWPFGFGLALAVYSAALRVSKKRAS